MLVSVSCLASGEKPCRSARHRRNLPQIRGSTIRATRFDAQTLSLCCSNPAVRVIVLLLSEHNSSAGIARRSHNTRSRTNTHPHTHTTDAAWKRHIPTKSGESECRNVGSWAAINMENSF